MAPLGAAECLRSGVTTLVDAAYGGASVRACSAAGLRAIVAIEAFGGRRRRRAGRGGRARAARRRAGGRGRPARRAGRLAARPLHRRPGAVRRDRRARPRAWDACRHAPRRIDARARRDGARDGRAGALRRALRASSDPRARRARPARARDGRGARRARRRRGDRGAGGDRRRRGALPALERAARLRRRAAGAAARSRGARRPGHRQPVVGALAGHVRRAARGAAPGAREQRRSRGALDGRRRCSSRRSTARARSGSTIAARSLRGCSPTSSPCASTRTPFWPCDDPVSALVLGGSPALVTLVAIGGKPMYHVDSTEFERALPAAAAARSRLLEPSTPPHT